VRSPERLVELGHGRAVPGREFAVVDGCADRGRGHRLRRPDLDLDGRAGGLEQAAQRGHRRPGLVELGFQPLKVRGDQGAAGLRVGSGQHLADLADGHAELAEPADHLGGGHLRRGVVAVAGVRVDLGGLQQPGLVVAAQRFHAQVGDLEKSPMLRPARMTPLWTLPRRESQTRVRSFSPVTAAP